MASLSKLLFVSDVAKHGGVSTYLKSIVNAATSAHLEPVVLLDDDAAADEVADYVRRGTGVKPQRASLRRGRNDDAVVEEAFLKILHETKPSLVHAVLGSPRSVIVPREISIRVNLPLIVTEQFVSRHTGISACLRERIQHLYQGTAITIFVSEENKRLSHEYFGFVARQGIVIPNAVGMDPRGVNPHSRRLSGENQVITVARLSWQKGVDILIDAISLLKSSHSKLIILGDGELRSELELQSKRKCPGQVSFAGWLENVSDLVYQSDLFVLPSRSEGMPFALLEAMAVGVPCIASAVSGIPEALAFGNAGTLIPPDDALALARSIDDFFSSPWPYYRKADYAITHLQSHFGLQNTSRRLADCWRLLLDDAQHGTRS